MDRTTGGGHRLPAGAMAGPGTPSGGGSVRLGRNPNERVLSQQEVEEIKQARADKEAQAVEAAPKGRRLRLHESAPTEMPEPKVRVLGLRQEENTGDESAGGSGDAVSRDQPSRGRRLSLRPLPRDGSDEQGKAKAAGDGRSATRRSDAEVALEQTLKEKGFVISVQFFREGSIKQVRAAFSELLTQEHLISAILNRRDEPGKIEKCSYCDTVLKNQNEQGGHQNYQEEGIWKTIFTCRNRNCIQDYNDDCDRIHRAGMAR